uniref:Endoglucanase n=1 Tax=uncultured bacterium TaxID=77133 RepID=UPI000588E890|nr:Chain A, Endoglucanase [uncultured bacterium]3X17_B Chain B, Endoglucanase [uncultured bacterium]
MLAGSVQTRHDLLQGAQILVNQVGYHPATPKQAVLALAPGTAAGIRPGWTPTLQIVRADDGQVVWEGTMAGPSEDRLVSGDTLYRADFTSLTAPGRYVAQVVGGPRSPEFAIGPVYRDVLYAAARSYYLQRCGVAIDDPITGVSHALDHHEDGYVLVDDPFYRAGTRLEATGGWHDAGDYGKYVTTTAVTAAQLLKAYELYPQAFADGQLHLPESGNGVPDILDEVRWGLEWLFRMQRPDGAVYHKLAGLRWPGMIRPEQDVQRRYVYRITTQDTAKAAAAWAMAARIFAPFDAAFARKALAAAEQAWRFLAASGPILDYPAEDNSGSGPYDDRDDADDRFWAAVELWVVTGRAEYHDYIARMARTGLPAYAPVSWVNPAALGYFDYVTLGQKGDPAIRARLVQRILEGARSVFQTYEQSGYGVPILAGSFHWGSNKEALAKGMLLLFAHHLEPRPEYERAALAQLDYVLGVNPLAKSYVTGLGSNPPRNPHHRLVKASGVMVPGLLVGGPNDHPQTKAIRPHMGPRGYADVTDSYETNEPAIDYNAPLVFVAAHFASL